jgi:hypothetical protein
MILNNIFFLNMTLCGLTGVHWRFEWICCLYLHVRRKGKKISSAARGFYGNEILLDCTASNNKQTPWPESASELYGPSDRRLLTKLVPTFADRGCHVVSVTDRYGRILGFLDPISCDQKFMPLSKISIQKNRLGTTLSRAKYFKNYR